MTKLDKDNNILWYDDANIYVEMTVSSKIYAQEKSLTIEIDCQWKSWEELYPIVFIQRKELYSKQDLIDAITNSIVYINKISNFQLSPMESSIIEEFAESMILTYWI